MVIVILKLSATKSPFQGIFDPHPAQRYKQNMFLYEAILVFIIETLAHLKTQEMCNKTVRIGTYSLMYVPDWCKTQEMCIEAVCSKPFSLDIVPDQFKTKKMCKDHNHWHISLIGIRCRSCATR